jgi:hypothetical protein
MKVVGIGGIALAASLAIACGGEPIGPTPRAAGGPGDREVAPARIGGRYEVSGYTVDRATGERRKIGGVVVLVQDGARYRSHFELRTVTPGGAPRPAEVIGTGEGTIAGATLQGVADTQLVSSSVPGLDVGFAFAPHDLTTRIASTTRGEIAGDGTLRVEIDNRGAEGAAYRPTHTRLRGTRVEAAQEPAP